MANLKTTKLILGLVGSKGSGKGTFCKLLQSSLPKMKVEVIRFSDLLRETLKLWSLDPTRANLQDMAIIMEQHFGQGTLANAIRQRISSLNADIVIVDGVRWMTDYHLIRSFPKNILVAVSASIETRYQRTKQRGEKSDEANVSFEQFVAEEEKLTETSIDEISKQADIILDNNGSVDDFKKAVEDFTANYPF